MFCIKGRESQPDHNHFRVAGCQSGPDVSAIRLTNQLRPESKHPNTRTPDRHELYEKIAEIAEIEKLDIS
jgi:hypothetical protein